MAMTIWSSASSWTLTALPLFVWMGEILYRTNLSESMFRGLAPWVNALPGRLLHTNVIGCTIFAAVSGSSAATCATVGKMNVPELRKRGYPENMVIGSLGGPATLGLLIPPSIILIVYGVSAELSISKLFMAGVLPGIMLALMFSGWIMVWALMNPDKVPKADSSMSFRQKVYESRHLIPVVLLISGVIASIYSGIATATEAAGIGVTGALILSALQGALTWKNFKEIAVRSHPSVLHDCADPRRCSLHDLVHGLYRPATPAGRIRGQPEPLARHADCGAGPVLHSHRLLSGRHLHHCADLQRGSAHHPGRRHRPPVVRHLPRDHGGDRPDHATGGLQPVVLQGMTGKQITYLARVCAPYFLLMVLALVILWFFPQIVTVLPNNM
jgi:TRAP-type C4-dicarboxylate transport system permease large subunit